MATQSLVVNPEVDAMDVDSKFFTGICTLFVASIVEAKEYITQLELMFCGRLYPNFVSELSKSMEALETLRKTQENDRDKWQEEKSAFFLDIERLKKSNDADKELQKELENLKFLLKEQEGLSDTLKKDTEALRLGHRGLLKENQNLQRSLDESLKNNEQLSHCNKRLCVEKEELEQKHVKLRNDMESLKDNYQSLSKDLDELLQKQSTSSQTRQFTCLDLRETCTKLQNEQKVSRNLYDELKEMNSKLERDRLEFDRLRADFEREQNVKKIALAKLRVMKKKYQNIQLQYNSILSRQVVASFHTKEKSNEPKICKFSEEDEVLEPVKKKLCPKESYRCFDNKEELNDLNDCRPNGRCQSEEREVAAVDATSMIEKVGNDSRIKAKHPLNCRMTDGINPNEEISVESSEGALDLSLCADTATDGKKVTTVTSGLNRKTYSSQETSNRKTYSSQETSNVSVEQVNDGSLAPASSNLPKNVSTIRDNFVENTRNVNTNWTKRINLVPAGTKETWRNTRIATGDAKFDLHDDFLNTPQELAVQALAVKIAISTVKASPGPSAGLPPTAHQHIENSLPVEHESCFADSPAFVPDSLSLEGENIALISTTGSNTSKSDSPLAIEIDHEGNPATVNRKRPYFQQGNTIEGHLEKDVIDPSIPLPPEDRSRSCLSSNQQIHSHKFVEPVRKKSDRDNLLGLECKQCKKFYDAVLAEDAQAVMTSRCEHHDGVSRHRYRYIPPATPDGFWNIGFDSEM